MEESGRTLSDVVEGIPADTRAGAVLVEDRDTSGDPPVGAVPDAGDGGRSSVTATG
jgi:hypothetical protein